MYEIEKGIELPPSRNGPSRSGGPKYPWAVMNVGDSFFVAGAKQGRISSAATNASKHRPGVKFTTRVVDGGVRVWRIA